MLTIFLGLVTAVTYGFADFFGAVASKKIKAVTVTFVSGVSGLALLGLATPFLGADFSTDAVFWGVLAGLGSAVAMSALYAALAIGPISIMSPLTAVISAIVPMIVGVTLGERFSWLGWVALGVILIAVALVGFVPGEHVRLPSARGLVIGLIAGGGIGFVLICLDQSPADSGLGPIILMRAVAASLLGLVTLIAWMRSRARTAGAAEGIRVIAPDRVWLAVIVAGLFDATANICFTLASREGTLSVVAVLTALYPVGTLILARFVLKERIARSQLVGIALAIGASALLAIA